MSERMLQGERSRAADRRPFDRGPTDEVGVHKAGELQTTDGPRTTDEPLSELAQLLRIGALALALGVGAMRGTLSAETPWLAALVIPELLVRGRALSSRTLWMLAVWWAVVVGVAAPLTGRGLSPLLPCLPVAAFMGASAGGAYAIVVVTTVALAAWIATVGSDGGPLNPAAHDAAAVSQWVALSVAVGLVTVWVTKITTHRHDESERRYAQAYALLDQLRTVTGRLPGTLDLTTTCEVLLDACRRQCGADKGAVLIGTDDAYLVPMAVTGTARVPWRGPLSGPGPLREAWESGRPVVDVRQPDVDGNRTGSVLLVVPLVGSASVLGLVALEARDPSAFTVHAIRRVSDTVRANLLGVETAKLFEEVRGAVTIDERSRLAREMHDGVAQDLAFVGFELDALRGKVNKVDPPLSDEIGKLRCQVTSIIADVRSSISDLKSTHSVERGLGSAIASYVRNVGATGRLVVHLTLRENAFRLPAETEVVLFRILQELTTVAQNYANAENLWVTLVVDAPLAELIVEHDGDVAMALKDPQVTETRLASIGGSLNVCARSPRGIVTKVAIGGWRS